MLEYWSVGVLELLEYCSIRIYCRDTATVPTAPSLHDSITPVFHFRIHSTISRAISSTELSLTILVSRSCFGSETLANARPSPVSFTGLAF